MQKLEQSHYEIELAKKTINHSESSSKSNISDLNESQNETPWLDTYCNIDSKKEIFEKSYYLATLCLKYKKYEDALIYVDDMLKNKEGELAVDERNVFIGAYEFYLFKKRFSWRSVFTMETNDQKMKLMFNDIKSSYEEIIIKTCERIINLINNYALKHTKSDDGLAVLLRIKADHYRYMAEITNSQTLFKNKQNAFNFYKQAYDLSLKLHDLDPIKLGIVMNYSVFLYEILCQRVNSIFYAKRTLNKALIKLKEFSDDELADDSLRESLTIIEILSKNLQQWYSEEFLEGKNNSNTATADKTK